jgi:hypothetical protein
VGAGSLHGGAERHPLDVRVAGSQKLVGPVLHPSRHIGIRWTAVRRVVLETAVPRRVVRWRDDDAVGTMGRAIAVVGEDGPGNHRSRCEAVVFLDDGFDVVRGQDLERRALRRR